MVEVQNGSLNILGYLEGGGAPWFQPVSDDMQVVAMVCHNVHRSMMLNRASDLFEGSFHLLEVFPSLLK